MTAKVARRQVEQPDREHHGREVVREREDARDRHPPDPAAQVGGEAEHARDKDPVPKAERKQEIRPGPLPEGDCERHRRNRQDDAKPGLDRALIWSQRLGELPFAKHIGQEVPVHGVNRIAGLVQEKLHVEEHHGAPADQERDRLTATLSRQQDSHNQPNGEDPGFGACHRCESPRDAGEEAVTGQEPDREQAKGHAERLDHARGVVEDRGRR